MDGELIGLGDLPQEQPEPRSRTRSPSATGWSHHARRLVSSCRIIRYSSLLTLPAAITRSLTDLTPRKCYAGSLPGRRGASAFRPPLPALATLKQYKPELYEHVIGDGARVKLARDGARGYDRDRFRRIETREFFQRPVRTM